MSNTVVSRLKKKKIQEVVNQGNRMDGRSLEDLRELVIKQNILEKAEGSAEVWLGKTHVVVGVKVGEGHPFEDTPDAGVLMTNAELTPVAHPTWEPGPPRENSIEVARVVDRGLRSAKILDMKDFCIEEGKKVLIIFVDLYVLNYDGNLIDACSAGALAALMCAKRPVYKKSKGEMILTNKKELLKLRVHPVAVTTVKIGDKLILDATADEEEVMDARITVTVDEHGNVTAIQKSGPAGLSLDEIKKCINNAVEKAPEIRAKIVESE